MSLSGCPSSSKRSMMRSAMRWLFAMQNADFAMGGKVQLVGFSSGAKLRGNAESSLSVALAGGLLAVRVATRSTAGFALTGAAYVGEIVASHKAAFMFGTGRN